MSARTIFIHCPVAGCDEVKTEGGLKQHIKRVHPQPAPGGAPV